MDFTCSPTTNYNRMEAAKDQEEINGTLTKCILKLMESPITTLTCVQNENRFFVNV